jgi:hypothetical protein
MKKILFATLLALPMLAGAVSSNKVKIARVEVTDAFFTIYAVSGDFGKQTCDVGNPIAFRNEDFPNHSQMLSTALAAHMSGKEVTMWFNGCQASPWSGTMPKPTSLVIH